MRVVDMHIHSHVINRRLVNLAIHMVKRRLMREMLRRKSLLVVHLEWIEILERLVLHLLLHVRVESVKCNALMAGMQGAFRGGKR